MYAIGASTVAKALVISGDMYLFHWAMVARD